MTIEQNNNNNRNVNQQQHSQRLPSAFTTVTLGLLLASSFFQSLIIPFQFQMNNCEMMGAPRTRQFYMRKVPLLCSTLLLSLCSMPALSFHAPSYPISRIHSRRIPSTTLQLEQSKESNSDTSTLFSVNSATRNATTVSTSHFSDEADARSASFGDVVRPKYLSDSSNTQHSTGSPSDSTPTTTSIDEVEVAAQIKRRNWSVAIVSVAVAFLNYFWQFTHPINPVQLLVGMEENSAPVSVIGENGKPTVVDFWAPVGFDDECMFRSLFRRFGFVSHSIGHAVV